MITIDAFNEFLTKIDHPSQRERIEEVLSWIKETFPQLKPEIK